MADITKDHVMYFYGVLDNLYDAQTDRQTDKQTDRQKTNKQGI